VVQNKKNDLNKSSFGYKNYGKTYQKIAPYLNVGYVWAISVGLLTYVGWYFDKKWNTEPWLTILGAFWGIIGGFYHFLKTVMKEDKKQNKLN